MPAALSALASVITVGKSVAFAGKDVGDDSPAARVALSAKAALATYKFATNVVDAIDKGGEPVETEEVIKPLASSVVTAAVALVVAPIATLFMLPRVPGLMVTTPDPVGDNETFAFAGFSVTAALASKVVVFTLFLVLSPNFPGCSQSTGYNVS